MYVYLFARLFFTTYSKLVSRVVPNEDGHADHQECHGRLDDLCNVPSENKDEGSKNDKNLQKLNNGLNVLRSERVMVY